MKIKLPLLILLVFFVDYIAFATSNDVVNYEVNNEESIISVNAVPQLMMNTVEKDLTKTLEDFFHELPIKKKNIDYRSCGSNIESFQSSKSSSPVSHSSSFSNDRARVMSDESFNGFESRNSLEESSVGKKSIDYSDSKTYELQLLKETAKENADYSSGDISYYYLNSSNCYQKSLNDYLKIQNNVSVSPELITCWNQLCENYQYYAECWSKAAEFLKLENETSKFLF